jgi:hypothetical protein
MEVVIAASSDPTVSATKAATKTFSLPTASLGRPVIGMKLEAVSR